MLRLNELYSSVQGEGPNVGTPTIFCRFSGCNLRCPGWPCDTPYAIFPDQWKDDPKLLPVDLIFQIKDLADRTGAKRVCITGGEPFLQSYEDLAALADLLIGSEFEIDVFTNGTFPFPQWVQRAQVNVVMDWKLVGSGDHQRGQENRLKNVRVLGRKDGIKFVVKDLDDLQEAESLATCLPFLGTYWVGRVWGTPLTDADLVQYTQDHRLNWRLNVQSHKLIWPTKDRGI